MRQPTPKDQIFAVWRQMLADPSTPRHDGHPEPGLYRVKRVKGGPWLALAITVRQVKCPETGELTEPETLFGILMGEELPLEELNRLWLYAQPVPRETYELLRKRTAALTPEQTTAPVDLTRAFPRPPMRQ